MSDASDMGFFFASNQPINLLIRSLSVLSVYSLRSKQPRPYCVSVHKNPISSA